MPTIWLLTSLLILAVAGFVLGRGRAMASAGGDQRNLHSLPNYYGYNAMLYVLVPALLVLAAWLVVQPLMIGSIVQGELGPEAIPEGSTLGLVMVDVRRVAEGIDIALAQGAMPSEMASSLRSDFTDVRARLGEVGVALGSHHRGARRLGDADRCGLHRDPHHHRHRSFAHFQHCGVLRALPRLRVLLPPRMGAELFGAGRILVFGYAAAPLGHALHLAGRPHRRGSDRAALGNLSL